MIVFVAGMPRAGSMWTFNVVRALYRSINRIVLPEKIPVNETDLIAATLSSTPEDNIIYCIKTHMLLSRPIPTQHDVKIISNIRDVRDASLSFMRFMHADFDTGMKTMMGMMQTVDHYINSFRDNLLTIRYEEIGDTPIDTLNNICDFLDISVSDEEKIAIKNEFSKTNIKNYLKKLSDIKIDNKGIIQEAEYQEDYDVINNFDGTHRVFDKSTSFQSNHITSKTDGEWRECLSENQVEQINNISKEWLLKYKYKL